MNISKGSVLAFLPVILGTLSLAGPAFADPIVVVQPSALNVTGTAAFSIDIVISGVTDLAAFGFDVGFNPAVLEATSTAEGAFLPGGGDTFFVEGSIDNAGGVISAIGDVLSVSSVTGSGVLATVSFNSIGDGASPITLFNVTLLDSSLFAMAPEIRNGEVSVSGIASPIPEPSALVLLGTALLGLAVRLARR